MKYLIGLFFGILFSLTAHARELSIEEIYKTCAMVESTIETVVNYRDTGTPKEQYISLVDKKMIDMGIHVINPKLFDKVHWFINYIFDNSEKDLNELESDIDFICKSDLMEGGWW